MLFHHQSSLSTGQLPPLTGPLILYPRQQHCVTVIAKFVSSSVVCKRNVDFVVFVFFIPHDTFPKSMSHCRLVSQIIFFLIMVLCSVTKCVIIIHRLIGDKLLLFDVKINRCLYLKWNRFFWNDFPHQQSAKDEIILRGVSVFTPYNHPF